MASSASSISLPILPICSHGLTVFDLDFGPRRDLGVVLHDIPPRQRWHPEDIFLGVVVAYFQLGLDISGTLVGPYLGSRK